MPRLRALKIGDEEKLIPLFKLLTGRDILIEAAALIADPGMTCLVFEINDELVGFGSLVIHQVPTKGEVARIEDVVIADGYQGRGLGKTLILKLLEVAKEQKINKINLTSNPMRVSAQKLYESVGFLRDNTDTFSLFL